MAYIPYPPDLPGPQPGSLAPRGRRVGSSLDGSPQQRARQRDVAGGVAQCTWVYTPEEMAIWLAWYRDDLADGRYWFVAFLPGLQGLQRPKLVRYLEVQQALLGQGLYRVTAKLELRANLPPNICYFSQVYPYVADEAMSTGIGVLRDGRLVEFPVEAFGFSLGLPLDGGQLRDVARSWDQGSEDVGLGLAIPQDGGQLRSATVAFSQYGSEAFELSLGLPISGTLHTVLITQDQSQAEGIAFGLSLPGNGSLS